MSFRMKFILLVSTALTKLLFFQSTSGEWASAGSSQPMETNNASYGTAMGDGRYHLVPPLIFSATGPKEPVLPNVGSSNALISFNSTDYNIGSGFNLEESTFYAPLPGFYSFNLLFNKIAKSSTDCRVFIFKNHNDLVASGFAGGSSIVTIDIFTHVWLGLGGCVNARYQGDCGAIQTGADLPYEDLMMRASARFSGELLAISSVPFPVVCEPRG